MSRRRLGRGLAALIPDDVMDARPVQTEAHRRVPLSSIHTNPEQPRTHFDAGALDELSRSIAEHGVLMPLLVMSTDAGYQLIAGERRLRAAGLAGLDEVPVVVHPGSPSPEVQLELALVENLQRQDLDPVESARGYRRLQLDYGYTQEQVAQKVAKDRSTVANSLRLLRLPASVLELISGGQLSTGHAKALMPLSDDDDALRNVVSQVLVKGLSVRATEQLVRARGVKRKSKKAPRTDRAVRAVSDLLARELQTGVDLKPRSRGNGGSIVISYGSSDELERLIKLLRTGAESQTSGP